jgi:hypothetical protein
MSASPPNTLPTEGRASAYVPLLDPATATVEETDEWILALGGQQLSAEELRAVVREVRWADVPGENPGDPDFPLASALR